jgi:hypothetical protein
MSERGRKKKAKGRHDDDESAAAEAEHDDEKKNRTHDTRLVSHRRRRVWRRTVSVILPSVLYIMKIYLTMYTTELFLYCNINIIFRRSG